MDGDPFDLVVRGGSVVDGTGRTTPIRADVGVRAGRIAAVGDLAAAATDASVAADGRVVAPGFIDPHAHVEAAILGGVDEAIGPSVQGVTTVLTGPDGFGWAPLPPKAAAELWAATASIYGSMPDALATRSVGDYLGAFVGRSPVNLLPQVPGAVVRFAAMGWDSGPASGRRATAMEAVIDDWLTEGATGLSVGLDYEPGARASEDELTALPRIVGRHDGTLAAHIRYEDAGRAEGYAEMARIGRATGARIVLAHERRDDVALAALERIGGDPPIAIEAYGYNASSTHLGILLPAAVRAGGPTALAGRLAQPAERAQVAAVLASRIAADRQAGDRIVFAASADPARIGREIQDCADEAGLDVGAFAAECLASDPAALFVYRHDGRHDHEDVENRTWTDPRTLVASDGIYVAGRMHPRGFGTFPRMLRVAVRERGLMSLSSAIHAMTGRPAAIYRVPERGTIEVGSVADLVVLDPNTVADRADWDHPTRRPVGIEHVFVAGVAVVAHGRPTGSLPGRVLRVAASRASSI